MYRKVVGEKKRGLHRRIKIAYPCSKFVETERFLKILSYFPSKIELIQNVPQLFEKIHIEKMLNPAMGHKTFSKQKQTSHLKISEPIPFDWSGVSRIRHTVCNSALRSVIRLSLLATQVREEKNAKSCVRPPEIETAVRAESPRAHGMNITLTELKNQDIFRSKNTRLATKRSTVPKNRQRDRLRINGETKLFRRPLTHPSSPRIPQTNAHCAKPNDRNGPPGICAIPYCW